MSEAVGSKSLIPNSQSMLPAKPGGKTSNFINSQLLDCLIVFTGAALFALVFHFTQEPPRRTLCFDARQYLFDTERMATFLLQLFKGKLDTAPLTSPDFLASILADGPMFPLFHGVVFALLGHSPQITDWRVIQSVQSIMHGCSAAMICLLSARLTHKRWLAVAAGLTWGIYPAAVFWSGIFYTETTVIFFALIMACGLTAPRLLRNDCIGGLAAGSLFLLKPALVPAVALALLSRLKDWKHLSLIVCFMVLPIIPWAAYTKVMTGHASFTAQRFPSFNLAMGADTEVGACMVAPPSMLTSMFATEKDPLAFPLSQWTYHFGDCAKMAVEKISILFANQSNDFRESYFRIPPLYQNGLHWLIVCFGFAGFLSLIAAGRARFNQISYEGKQVVWMCSAVLASHFAYILFTPSARYGFTSTPFLLVMGTFFLNSAASALSNRAGYLRTSLVPFVASACLLIAMVAVAHSAGPGATDELLCELKPGDSAIKMLDLSKSRKPVRDHYAILMVDGDGDIESAVVELNGKPLSSQLKHIRYFDSEIYRQSFELLSLGYPMGMELSDFRNWRAIEIDPSALNWNGKNTIKIIASYPTVLYADKRANERRMLSPSTYCVNILGNSCERTDPRIVSPILAAEASQISTVKSKSPSATQAAGSLRIKLGIGLKNGSEVSTPYLSETYSSPISHKAFDLYMQDVDGIKMNRRVIKAVQGTGAKFPFPEMKEATHLRITLRGELRSETRKGSAGIVVAVLPGAAAPSINLSSAPNSIPATSEWKSFEIVDTLPQSMLAPDAERSLYVALYPGSWLDVCGYGADKSSPSVKLRNLSFEVTGVKQSDFANRRMLYY